MSKRKRKHGEEDTRIPVEETTNNDLKDMIITLGNSVKDVIYDMKGVKNDVATLKEHLERRLAILTDVSAITWEYHLYSHVGRTLSKINEELSEINCKSVEGAKLVRELNAQFGVELQEEDLENTLCVNARGKFVKYNLIRINLWGETEKDSVYPILCGEAKIQGGDKQLFQALLQASRIPLLLRKLQLTEKALAFVVVGGFVNPCLIPQRYQNKEIISKDLKKLINFLKQSLVTSDINIPKLESLQQRFHDKKSPYNAEPYYLFVNASYKGETFQLLQSPTKEIFGMVLLLTLLSARDINVAFLVGSL